MKRYTLLSIALLTLLGSCGIVKSTKGQSFNLESTKWQTQELNGRAIEREDNSFTIEFAADNRIAAKGSCNVIVGSYNQESGGKLELSPMGLTRSACPDMATEREYVSALESVTSFSVVDGTLILFAEDQELLRLVAIE